MELKWCLKRDNSVIAVATESWCFLKPIIIAGNGPSLRNIDYARMPQVFDVYRCNQFYFEDQYFLGKKIKGVFCNHFILKDFFFTIYQLKEKEEYEIDAIYSFLSSFDNHKKSLEYFSNLSFYYPLVKDIHQFLKMQKEYYEWILYKSFYENKFLNMGIYMILTAISQGYKQIYLTGIDPHHPNSYAFDMQNKSNLFEKVPSFQQKENFANPLHCNHFNLRILKMIAKQQNIQIFCLSKNNPFNSIIPMAPLTNSNFYPQEKPKGFINDLCLTPKDAKIHSLLENKKPTILQKLKSKILPKLF